MRYGKVCLCYGHLIHRKRSPRCLLANSTVALRHAPPLGKALERSPPRVCLLTEHKNYIKLVGTVRPCNKLPAVQGRIGRRRTSVCAFSCTAIRNKSLSSRRGGRVRGRRGVSLRHVFGVVVGADPYRRDKNFLFSSHTEVHFVINATLDSRGRRSLQARYRSMFLTTDKTKISMSLFTIQNQRNTR